MTTWQHTKRDETRRDETCRDVRWGEELSWGEVAWIVLAWIFMAWRCVAQIEGKRHYFSWFKVRNYVGWIGLELRWGKVRDVVKCELRWGERFCEMNFVVTWEIKCEVAGEVIGDVRDEVRLGEVRDEVKWMIWWGNLIAEMRSEKCGIVKRDDSWK